MAKHLMKGNEAIAAAAINAGCRHFFGYPITPQNEIPEYMSRELPKLVPLNQEALRLGYEIGQAHAAAPVAG